MTHRQRRRGGRKSLQRRAPTRTPKRTVLIVCEGGETEPTYFNAIRKAKRLETLRIKVVGGNEAGTHPKSVVEYAKGTQKEAKNARDPFDSVWCVFDRDVHVNINAAFEQARGNDFKIAFSNPSFELWYLLHFQDQGGHIERDKALKSLKRHIPRYNKSDNIYDQLAPQQDAATKRAKQLRKQHGIEDERCITESQNPSTWVDQLVEELHQLA